jgi:hypothetical protein
VGVALPFDLRVQERHDAFDVTPIPGLVAPFDELGVAASPDSAPFVEKPCRNVRDVESILWR